MKWDNATLRQALAKYSEDSSRRGYLATEDGRVFVYQLREYLAPTLTALASQRDFPMNTDEVSHTVLVQLASVNNVCVQIAQADNVWGFLYRCAERWVQQELGHRVWNSLDDLPDIFGENLVEQSVFADHELTQLDLVITQTREVLSTRTSEALRQPVNQLVEWLARNPPQRISYEGEEIQEAIRLFPLSKQQVQAVANICWGGRPSASETSLFAGFLLDVDFNPWNSPSTSRALAAYRARMFRATLYRKAAA